MEEDMGIINITAGELLNKYLSDIYDGVFIPFNEALSQGNLSYPLFDDVFIDERCKSLLVTKDEYVSKLSLVLSFIDNMDKYNEVVLWFGDETFCQINLLGVLTMLEQGNFKGSVVINIVDESSNKVIRKYNNVELGNFTLEYKKLLKNIAGEDIYNLF